MLDTPHMKANYLICVIALCCLANPIFADGELTIENLIFDNLLDYGSGVVNYINHGTDLSDKVDIKNDQDGLLVKTYGFKSLANVITDTLAANSLRAQESNNYDSTPLTLTKPLLNYPNPARQKEGIEIRYGLSRDAEIELQIYDMTANLVFKNQFAKGAQGAKVGYNRLYLTMNSFDKFALSAGVYFYLLVNEGVVIAKGKMAVVP